jgi:hypothetical protein
MERFKADLDAAGPSGHSFDSQAWIAHATVGLSSASEAAWEICRRPLDWLPNATQAALLRDLFGNPWSPPWWMRSAALLPGQVPREGYILTAEAAEQFRRALGWKDRTIPRLARRIYEERDWGSIPVLADAMEESGVTDEAILGHCRGLGPHARGCWVVDLLLGKR